MRWKAKLPTSRLRSVPGAGHLETPGHNLPAELEAKKLEGGGQRQGLHLGLMHMGGALFQLSWWISSLRMMKLRDQEVTLDQGWLQIPHGPHKSTPPTSIPVCLQCPW